MKVDVDGVLATFTGATIAYKRGGRGLEFAMKRTDSGWQKEKLS